MHQQSRISRIDWLARKEDAAALAHTLRIALVLPDQIRHPRLATREFGVMVLPVQQADAKGHQKDACTDKGRLRPTRLCRLLCDRRGELCGQPFD
jgi:hypothetical protein